MCRVSCLALSLWLCALVCPCAAQEAQTRRGPVAATPDDAAQTTEMLFYERERERYESPQMMVRRRAELKGLQRAERLAALKWYGKSNSRPAINPQPHWGGGYSSYWGSNTADPLRWRPFYRPVQGGMWR